MNTKISSSFPAVQRHPIQGQVVCVLLFEASGLLSCDLQLIDERSSDVTNNVLCVLVLQSEDRLTHSNFSGGCVYKCYNIFCSELTNTTKARPIVNN